MTGKIEPIFHFIARNGKLLGASCVLDRAQNSELFVTGQAHDLAPTDTVSCKALDQISPLSDIARRIVMLSNYNGLGCFNFKFVPMQMSMFELEHFLQILPTIPHDHPDAVLTDFGPEGLRHHFYEYGAAPKIFDFNTRECGSHTRHQTLELYKHLRMYLDAVVAEGEIEE